MNALQIFASEDFRIRAVMRDGEPWFVAVDICRALSIVDDRQAVDRLEPDERGGCIVPTPRGDQMVRAVSEAGLYSMIQTSRKPEAKLFRRWINHEVLPSIRKTGVYAIQPKHEIPKTYGEALRRAAGSAGLRRPKFGGGVTKNGQNGQNKPKTKGVGTTDTPLRNNKQGDRDGTGDNDSNHVARHGLAGDRAAHKQRAPQRLQRHTGHARGAADRPTQI